MAALIMDVAGPDGLSLAERRRASGVEVRATARSTPPVDFRNQACLARAMTAASVAASWDDRDGSADVAAVGRLGLLDALRRAPPAARTFAAPAGDRRAAHPAPPGTPSIRTEAAVRRPRSGGRERWSRT